MLCERPTAISFATESPSPYYRNVSDCQKFNQARSHGEGGDSVPQIVLRPEKFGLNKRKIFPPLKIYFSPLNLKTLLRA